MLTKRKHKKESVRHRRRLRARALRKLDQQKSNRVEDNNSSSSVPSSPKLADAMDKYFRAIEDGLDVTTSSTDSSEVTGKSLFTFPVPCRKRRRSSSENQCSTSSSENNPPPPTQPTRLLTPPPNDEAEIHSPVYGASSPCYRPTTPLQQYWSGEEDIKPPPGLEKILSLQAAGELLMDEPGQLQGLSPAKQVNKLLDHPESTQLAIEYHSDTSGSEKNNSPNSEVTNIFEPEIKLTEKLESENYLNPELGNLGTYVINTIDRLGQTPDITQAMTFPRPAKANVYQLSPNTIQLQIFFDKGEL